MASHVLTLDQLPTAVAIFDEKQHLLFCNLAYRTLWQFDEVFTRSQPTDNEILDHLRDARRLPEQADYKSWKKSLHEAYHSLETQEAAWYLPGGRTLRVVVNPNPQGGVTYLFEDVTAQFILQSNFNSLSRVQSETLDSLKEGVAVFGMDGRLKLNNPAFAVMWEIDAQSISHNPHIDEIVLQAKRSYDSPIIWNNIKGIIGGINDARTGYSFRMERNNGTIIECTLAPLPDGATLVTFIDVSASVHVERALKDKNDALEHAARLRENFVHHVSYQLRSPLTNVIGFTELLASGAAGLLTQKQSEYIDHVFESSKSLMAIIDDILDLASFDRGEIILELKKINIKQVINTAADALKDQLKERNLTLDIKISNNIDEFFLDEKRIQQILFNLLSNSIGFSLEGQSITIIAQLEKSKLNIVVKDNGRGIPEDVIESVFDRFETYTIGSRHRGAGLGLSIVRSLVELHGGTVTIESQPNKGTIVSCLFPPDCIETNKIEIA
jgi:signal transduction histidine kinase